MQAPEAFTEKLEREFQGRLRVRWSKQRSEWHIEQRVGRGLFPGSKPTKRGWDESQDAYVRYRDGYIFILAVTTGDRTPCPRCGHDLKVPFMRTEHVRCGFCRMQGKDPSIAVMHVPLNDSLIDYLKKIDPMNPISERLNEDLERANAALVASMEQDALDAGVSGFSERYNRIVGIPQVGYTGKQFTKAA